MGNPRKAIVNLLTYSPAYGFVPFFAFTFESFIEQVEITVKWRFRHARPGWLFRFIKCLARSQLVYQTLVTH